MWFFFFIQLNENTITVTSSGCVHVGATNFNNTSFVRFIAMMLANNSIFAKPSVWRIDFILLLFCKNLYLYDPFLKYRKIKYRKKQIALTVIHTISHCNTTLYNTVNRYYDYYYHHIIINIIYLQYYYIIIRYLFSAYISCIQNILIFWQTGFFFYVINCFCITVKFVV